MAICGIYGVVETLPLITGIDFVGIVDEPWQPWTLRMIYTRPTCSWHYIDWKTAAEAEIQAVYKFLVFERF